MQYALLSKNQGKNKGVKLRLAINRLRKPRATRGLIGKPFNESRSRCVPVPDGCAGSTYIVYVHDETK